MIKNFKIDGITLKDLLKQIRDMGYYGKSYEEGYKRMIRLIEDYLEKMES